MTSSEDAEAHPSLAHLRAVFAAGGFGLGIGETLGMRGVRADPGQVVIEATPTAAHHNPLGAVHGGYIATMLDAAMGLAVQTQVDIGGRYATTNLNIAYLRAVAADVPVLRSEARVVHGGRSLVFAEARVVDMAGRVYAHGSATFRVAA
jgi:uncharacterized protein (TIGR00369 family)